VDAAGLRCDGTWSEEDRDVHGEYKVPGGKLVVVDFEVADRHIAQVTVSGDFFLEPPEALETINRAIEGAPVDITSTELADRIRSALPGEVEMVGFSPEAVSTAVRRGIV
jgi:lipoate---protein ligase